MTQQTIPSEFSRPFAVDRLGAAPASLTLLATPEEREALAKRLGLVHIDRLAAMVTLAAQRGGIIGVSGRLEAEIVQTCVISLTPFAGRVEDAFEARFTTMPPVAGDEIVLDLDSDDPEPVENGIIDIGELVAQFLSLALDPYPKAPGAALKPSEAPVLATTSPFAALRVLEP